MFRADRAGPTRAATKPMQSAPAALLDGPAQAATHSRALENAPTGQALKHQRPVQDLQGLGLPPARAMRALREARARRDRNATARSADESEGRSARDGRARRAAPIAGTARRAARRRETAPCAPSSPARALDHPPAPAVERIGRAPSLASGDRGECVPALAPGHAGEHDRANVGELAGPLALREQESAARNEAASAGWRRRQSQPRAPFTRIVLRAGDKRRWPYPHVEPYWFIYEPSCAKPPHGAKTQRAPARRERRKRRRLSLDAAYSEVDEASFARVRSPAAPGIPTISTPVRPRR